MGPDLGPTLVCFPCAGGSAASFRALAAELAPRWRIVAIEPPGHGLNGGAPLERIEDMVDAYVAALAGHLREPYWILGHSMGGLVGYLVAARLQRSATPPRGVFVCAVRGPARVIDEPWSGLSQGELAARLVRIGGVPELLLERLDDFGELLAAVRADFGALEQFAMPAPPAVQVPTCVVAAADDSFVPPERVREWTRHAPRSRFVLLDGGGHFFHQTRAPELARLISREAERGAERMTSELEALGREVHVWTASTALEAQPERLDACRALLSADERERCRRYVLDSSRRQFVVAHALLRTALSRYVDRDPRDWRFRTGARGRPELVAEAGAPPLRFNLSHTGGLVAVAVGLERELGVDVEHLDRDTRTVELSCDFLAPSERAWIAAAAPGERARRFFALWTLKESYLKARGLGLSVPLDCFSFRLGTGDIAARFGADLGDDEDAWQFHQLWPTQRHVLAVALRRGSEPRLQVRHRSGDDLLELELTAAAELGAAGRCAATAIPSKGTPW